MKKKYWILIVVLVVIVGLVNAARWGIGIFNMIKDRMEDANAGSHSYESEEESFDYAAFGAELAEMVDSHAPDGEGEFATARLLVSTDFPLELIALEDAQVLPGPDDTYVVQFETPEAAEAAAQELSESEYVAYVQADTLDSVEEAVSWGPSYMGADYFAEMMLPEQVMVPTIAVVDSGVSFHEMFKGSFLTGWDFVDNDADPSDPNGHGTHVAGIVADTMGALEKEILPVRVMREDGKGYSSWIGLGIRYAADQGADVINLSLSGGHNAYKDDAIAYAQSKGCVVVVAAGNQKTDVCNRCPAHIESCITVSAIDSNYNWADFSNYGSAVDFCAPGVNIVSASNYGGHVAKQGTSMATPHISACAAMLQACGLAQNQQEVAALLTASCIDLGEPGWDAWFGHGLPDMVKAMDSRVYSELLNSYWIMAYESDAQQNLFEMVFYEDGTYTAVDMRDYAPINGTYRMAGTQIFLTMEFMDLYDVQFYYDDPVFRTVDYYDLGGLRGSYVLSRSEGYCFQQPEEPEPEAPEIPEPTEPASADGGLNPEWGPVTYPADGTYYIEFYVDSFRGDETRTIMTTDILSYVEIDDATAYSLQPGTTLQVGGYTLNIEMVSFSDYDGVQYLDINDWEYARYIPEIGRWRFYTVNDKPLSYAVSSANLLVPVGAQIWDYLTPFAYGQNVYGEEIWDFSDKTNSAFLLDRIDDYYYWHQADYSEYAYVTVQNGVVVRMEIPMHP